MMVLVRSILGLNPKAFFLFLINPVLWFSTISAAPQLFNFVIPWNDSSAAAIDLSSLVYHKIDQEGYVRATGDGHLAIRSGRIRFWGTNTTFSSNFPDKNFAPQLAAHLAKYGINMVRFHHMDMYAAGNGIWQTNSYDRTIDSLQRDKLEYFIDQLRKKGIYSDINLLVSRPFKNLGDLPSDIDLISDWKVRAALSFFDPQLQRLQKDYARDLLTHASPYTALTMAEDPAIAFVEIINENGLIQAYLSSQLDAIPPYYSKELNAQWNLWLKNRYLNQEALEKGWQLIHTPEGPEKIINGSFSSALGQEWSLQVLAPAAGRLSIVSAGAETGQTRAAKIDVTATDPVTWHVQLMQANLKVKPDTVYTLSFWAKADARRTINLNLMQAGSPYSNLGFSTNVNLTDSWTAFTFRTAVKASESNGRITFSGLAYDMGSVWLTGVSFREGGTLPGLLPDENLDSGAIRNFLFQGGSIVRTDSANKDWFRFLGEMESSYWIGMRDYLKNSLGVRALIFGTINGCTTPNLAALFDVVDTHAYWQHPSFPGQPWSATDWYQSNQAMVNSMSSSTVGSLAMRRILNKPHAVTEYNHASPNTFAADGYYFLSTYACLQDWDAVFSFDYGGGNAGWDAGKVESYFAVGQNPVKLGSFIAAAAAFLRGDISPATQLVTVPIGQEAELKGLLSTWAWQLVNAQTAGVNPKEALVHRVAIAVEGQTAPAGSLPPGADVPASLAISDTGQIRWDALLAQRAVVTVDSPRTKYLYGYCGNGTRSFDLSGVTIIPSTTLQNGYCTIALTAMDGASIPLASKIVITAAGAYQNSGQQWYQYPSTPIAFPPSEGLRITSRNQWGSAPSQMEGIAAEIVLPATPDRTRVWALDGTGARKTQLAVSDIAGRAKFTIDPSYNAMWYEVEVDRSSPKTTLFLPSLAK